MKEGVLLLPYGKPLQDRELTIFHHRFVCCRKEFCDRWMAALVVSTLKRLLGVNITSPGHIGTVYMIAVS
jgi:hypothetical protein